MLKKSVKMELVGCKVEIIGGSVYPKEESWSPLCPCCGKPLKIRLWFDDEACEFSLSINSQEQTNSGNPTERKEP
jgi:hypothetical protein